MTQAVSHSLETGVWLCRATDAKAHVSKATTPMSGNLLQSTNSTPGTNSFYPYNRRSGTHSITLSEYTQNDCHTCVTWKPDCKLGHSP